MKGSELMKKFLLVAALAAFPGCHFGEAVKEVQTHPDTKQHIGEIVDRFIRQPFDPFNIIDALATAGGLVALAIGGKKVHTARKKKTTAAPANPTASA